MSFHFNICSTKCILCYAANRNIYSLFEKENSGRKALTVDRTDTITGSCTPEINKLIYKNDENNSRLRSGD